VTWGDFGKITLPVVFGFVSHWIAIIILVAAFVGLFHWFEKKRL